MKPSATISAPASTATSPPPETRASWAATPRCGRPTRATAPSAPSRLRGNLGTVCGHCPDKWVSWECRAACAMGEGDGMKTETLELRVSSEQKDLVREAAVL